MIDYVYDIETFLNCFTVAIKQHGASNRWLFEISDRRNDQEALVNWMVAAKVANARMIGFNNIGFDYPVLHMMLEKSHSTLTARMAYDKAQEIIGGAWSNRFNHVIWKPWVDQVDLYKIHHFDNMARLTSLKVLEFNMRADNLQDLPYDPHTALTSSQMDELISYNWNDVIETERFLDHSAEAVSFREELSLREEINMINFNDTKIGKDFFARELEKASPGCCYDYSTGTKQIRQTKRSKICLGDVILPYVQFTNPAFQKIKSVIESTTITSTNKEDVNFIVDGMRVKELSCEVGGFGFHFGLGGIHGSLNNTTAVATEEEAIIDLDVTSYYPSLAIANNIFPEHLSDTFCHIYRRLFEERAQYGKKEAANKMLKLALNGVYGDSNSKYSPFFDTQYTMAITINGQLLLCMLAEQLMLIPGLKMIQINTDGLTFKLPRVHIPHVNMLREWWEATTQLKLEEANYSRMFIRDVNNYIAEPVEGAAKSKGCYEYELDWHKNFSALVVPKAAEAFMLHGTPVEEFIENHEDPYDFMLRAKVNRNMQLITGERGRLWKWEDQYVVTPMIEDVPETKFEEVTKKTHIAKAGTDHGVYPYIDTPQQHVIRYYVANNGPELFKLMEPTPAQKMKGRTHMRRNAIDKGFKVRVCNKIQDASPWDVNHQYYIEEAKKLLKPTESTI